jgi:DNA (cytosine-5)-methyltransferase 1
METQLLCEYWPPAADVLTRRFDAPVVGDIRELQSLSSVDVVTAGFPCTDLSQVGRTAGISGDQSGLIREVFRLIERTPPTWVVLENVPNMLTLHGGAPMRHVVEWLESHGWNWAYRTVDSQHFGVRQRRRRILLVASRTEDPRMVLFADETGLQGRTRAHSAYGFYWTEGNRGVGWGEGVTPTLKGGSGWGIASPPGVWRPAGAPGTGIVRPSIAAGERLQGFRAGWTRGTSREGLRWKMVGNAVTVPVAEWVGRRLVGPGEPLHALARPLTIGSRWPAAASGVAGQRTTWSVSERPLAIRQARTLDGVLATHGFQALSLRATSGFATRLARSSLRTSEQFRASLSAHVSYMSAVDA